MIMAAVSASSADYGSILLDCSKKSDTSSEPDESGFTSAPTSNFVAESITSSGEDTESDANKMRDIELRDGTPTSNVDSKELSGAKEHRRRQKLPNKQGLSCNVCGDKANGYNFGAVTCESCKAFFRRNALRTKQMVCEFEDDCKIDCHTRKFCSSCRLKKCLEINMKKEWILDEDTLKKRKRIIKKPKESNQMGDSCHKDGKRSSDDYPNCPPEPLSEEDQLEIDTILGNHSLIDVPESDQMDIHSTTPHTSITSKTRNLADDTSGGVTAVRRMADTFVRRIIYFVKTLPEFQLLDVKDQACLLQGGIFETLMLRSAIQYHPDVDGLTIENTKSERPSSNNLRTSFIKLIFGEEIYHELLKFITSINDIARWDKPTMILALIIHLFSPDREGLVNKDLVTKAEEKYSFLLQAYLRSKYTLYEARSIYPKLLLKLADVRVFGDLSIRQIILDSKDSMEFLQELFSMKDHKRQSTCS